MELRRRPVLLLLAFAVLVLTGCELGATVDVRLDRDGAGRLEISLAADRALLAAAERGGADPLAELERRLDELDGGRWRTASRTTDEGGSVLSFSTDFAGPEAFERLLDEFTAGLATVELAPLGPLALTRSEDRLQLAGWAALVPGDAVSELGLDMPSALDGLAAVDYAVRVSLPGEVLEHNATEADGSVLTWRIPAGERVDIRAVGARPADRTLPLLLGGVLAAAVTMVLLRRRPGPVKVPVATPEPTVTRDGDEGTGAARPSASR